VIVLDIPESTPSLNRTTRMHWVKRHQMRAKWQWLVKAARLDARIFLKEPLPKARITIERFGPKLLDYDNLVGGACKALIDSLVREGLILDDKPECIGQPQYFQHIGPRRTVVRIEPAEAS
jgi:hypothetical protein